jgi:hypothetical protein
MVSPRQPPHALNGRYSPTCRWSNHGCRSYPSRPLALVRFLPLIPFHLVDPQPCLKADYRDTTARFFGYFVHAMNGDGLLLLLGFSDLHDMDPLVIVHVLAIRLGIDLVLEEPDILKFRGTNPGGGGGGRSGRVRQYLL